MVSLLSNGHLVTMRRWWNIQGPVQDWVYLQCCGKGICLKSLSDIQLPFATKTEPGKVQQMSKLQGCQHWSNPSDIHTNLSSKWNVCPLHTFRPPLKLFSMTTSNQKMFVLCDLNLYFIFTFCLVYLCFNGRSLKTVFDDTKYSS